MSLKAWYPFNGTINNQGAGALNLTQVTAPVYATGGKVCNQALSRGGFKWTATQTNSILNNEAISIAFWIKVLNSNGGDAIFGNTSMTAPNNRRFTLYNYPKMNDFHWSWQNENSGDAINGGTIYGCFPTNTWTHCCITYTNGTAIAYINGVEKSRASNKYIENSSYAYETTVIHSNDNRHIQDFRVYDHCLTPREVKHLSQGLAWHLKLDNVSNINLLTSMSPGGRTTVTNKYHVNMDLTDQKDTYFYFNVSPALELNKTYTISFDVSGYPEGLGKWSFYLFKQGNANYLYYINGNGHHTWTFTTDPAKLPTDYSLTQFIADDGSRPVGVGTVKLSNFKIEEGNSDTLWRPHSADTTLNYDIEYDCSGYKSHANRYGIRGVRDTARYSHSAEFTGGDYLRSDTMDTNGQDELTLSAWVNPSTYTATGSSTDRQTIIIGGVYLTLANGYVSSYCYGKTTSYFTDKTTKIPLNTWSHVVASWQEDGVHKLYVNGKMVAQTTQTVAPASGDRHKKKEVGAETNGASRQFQGKISDVRIYTTALSDDDIKELYEVATSYHENGVFETYYLDSDKNISNLKYYRNKTQVKNFSEIGYLAGMKIKILPEDNSVWGRIYWLDLTNDTTIFSSDDVNYSNQSNRFSRLSWIDHFKTNLLPKGYTKLNYIESTGNQYIDTGYYWTSETVQIVMDAYITSNASNQSLFGNEEPYEGSNRYFAIIPHGSNGSFNIYTGTGSVTIVSTGLNTRFTLDCSTAGNKLTTKLNGTQISSVAYSGTIKTYANSLSTDASKGKIYIFANHNSKNNGAGPTQNIGGMRLYSFKMYDNGVMVRNFIPCKNASGEIGLYDMVYDNFYKSPQGTAFTAGVETSNQGADSEYYEFMLTLPQVSSTGFNRWRQTNSPNSSQASGLKKIKTTWPTHSGALIKVTNSKYTANAVYATNTADNWWSPIGQTTLYEGTGIPGTNGKNVKEIELWVRIDNLPKLNKISMLNNKYIQAFEIKEN